jgi:hypothetical protein
MKKVPQILSFNFQENIRGGFSFFMRLSGFKLLHAFLMQVLKRGRTGCSATRQEAGAFFIQVCPLLYLNEMFDNIRGEFKFKRDNVNKT